MRDLGVAHHDRGAGRRAGGQHRMSGSMEEYGGMMDPHGATAGEPSTAHAGAPLESGGTPADDNTVIEALRTIFDPEIPVNIYELGLIYDLRMGADGKVGIDMTLTAPACPV